MTVSQVGSIDADAIASDDSLWSRLQGKVVSVNLLSPTSYTKVLLVQVTESFLIFQNRDHEDNIYTTAWNRDYVISVGLDSVTWSEPAKTNWRKKPTGVAVTHQVSGVIALDHNPAPVTPAQNSGKSSRGYMVGMVTDLGDGGDE